MKNCKQYGSEQGFNGITTTRVNKELNNIVVMVTDINAHVLLITLLKSTRTTCPYTTSICYKKKLLWQQWATALGSCTRQGLNLQLAQEVITNIQLSRRMMCMNWYEIGDDSTMICRQITNDIAPLSGNETHVLNTVALAKSKCLVVCKQLMIHEFCYLVKSYQSTITDDCNGVLVHQLHVYELIDTAIHAAMVGRQILNIAKTNHPRSYVCGGHIAIMDLYILH